QPTTTPIPVTTRQHQFSFFRAFGLLFLLALCAPSPGNLESVLLGKSKPENPYVCLVFLGTSSTRRTHRVPFQPDQRRAKPRANRPILRHPRMWHSRVFPRLLRDPGDLIFLRRWGSLAPFGVLPCTCRLDRLRGIKLIHTYGDTPCTNRTTLPGCKSMPV